MRLDHSSACKSIGKASLLAVLFFLWSGLALGQSSPYNITQLTTDPNDHMWPAVNNNGDIVWSQQVSGLWQVFKCPNGCSGGVGTPIPVPDPSHNFRFPDISDAGNVVYLKDGAGGGIGLQVILNQNGGESVVEFSSSNALSGAYRNAGQHFGISGNGTIISYYDFCSPYTCVRRFDVSGVGQLPGDFSGDDYPDINANGDVVYSLGGQIEKASVTNLSAIGIASGTFGRINNPGDIVVVNSGQISVYPASDYTQSNSVHTGTWADINDTGVVVFQDSDSSGHQQIFEAVPGCQAVSLIAPDPVTPGPKVIGTVDAHPGGSLSRDGKPTSEIAIFRPTQPLSLIDAAKACGFVGFNWQQEFTFLPPENAFVPFCPSCMNPANLTDIGSLQAPPSFFDPPQGGGYTYKDGNTYAYPFFWDASDLDGLLPCSLGVSESVKTSNILNFVDCPADALLPSGSAMKFQTSLVGVLPCPPQGANCTGTPQVPGATPGPPSGPLYTWTWESSFNGMTVSPPDGTGGISQTKSVLPIDPATGTGGVTITSINGVPVPTVTVTLSSPSIATADALSVAVLVSGGASGPTPTGSIILTSGSYTSAPTTLSSGSATIDVPAGSLAVGTDTLMVRYVPDSASVSTYANATALASVTVTGCGATLPVTTASVSGPLGNSSWYLGPVQVSLSATDTSSTVAKTFLTLDGGTQKTYAAPFSVSGDAVHQLSFYSVDACDNPEKPNSLTIKIDSTPPVTTVSASGPAGLNGWYRGPVTLNFSATDNLSGVAGTAFSTDGGTTWTNRTSVTLTADGIYNVLFHSTDVAGNVEAAKSIQVKIDKTAPVVTANASPTTLWPPNGNMVPVTISGSVSDSTSGVNPANVTFAAIDKYGSVQPSGAVAIGTNGAYSFTILLQASRLGTDKAGRVYTITVSGQDNAGNTGSSATEVIVPHDQGN